MTTATEAPSMRAVYMGIAALLLGAAGLIATFTAELGQQAGLFVGLGSVVLLVIGASVMVWAKKKPTFVSYAIFAALLTLAAAFMAGFGYANEWWSVGTAFTILRFAAFAAVGYALVNIVSSISAFRGGNMAKGGASLLSVAACALLALGMLGQLGAALSVPRIHDATTDLDNIPTYSKLSPNNPNGEDWHKVHAEGYPELKAITLDMSVADVIAKAEAAAKGFGWEIAVADAVTGRFEATETTRFFEFKDDIVLRVVASGDGNATVDARSVSRFAGSDIGVNAARIKRLFAALKAG